MNGPALCPDVGRSRIEVANEVLKAREIAQGVEVVVLRYPDREGNGVDLREAGIPSYSLKIGQ